MTAGQVELRSLAPGELAAFHECAAIAFHERVEGGDLERFARVEEPDRSWAAFDGTQVVGTATAYTMRLSIPGGDLECAGISWLTVLPTHRRRGLLTRLLDHALSDACERGEPLAALWATSGSLYGRFGFGAASFGDEVRIALGRSLPRALGDGDHTLTVQPVGRAAVPPLAELYERCRHVRPGMPSRTIDWWEARLLADPTLLVLVAHDGQRQPVGYALYRSTGAPPTAVIRLNELIATDPSANAALWRYLCALELAVEIEAPHRPTDDASAYLFEDHRRFGVEARHDCLWLRLLDVPRALQERRWATDVDLVLSLADARLARNAGTWRLETRADDRGRCSRTDRSPDVALDCADLAAAYLGAVPLARLAEAGRVVEHTPGAVTLLDEALRVPLAPWTPEHF